MQVLQTLLPYLQILISVLLIGTVLFQQRGSGLGAAFGGEGNIYHTKRGFERILYVSTIVLGGLFFVTAFMNLII